MKRAWITLLTIVMTFSLVGGAIAKTTLKLGMPGPPKDPHTVATVWQADYVKAKTNGELTIDVYPMSQLGGERSMAEQVQSGTLAMASITTAVLSNFVPEVTFFDLPFLWPSRGVAYSVLNDSEFWKIISDAFAKRGFVAVGYGENQLRDLTNTKRVVRTPEDVKGLKIRVMESPVYLETWRTLGANPVPMPFPELYNALQQGVVDAQENPVMISALVKFTEVCPYVTFLNYSLCESIKIINIDTWNKLTPEQQDLLKDSTRLALQRNREAAMNLTKKLTAGLEKAGKNTITHLSADERKAFYDAVQPVYTKMAKKMGTIPNKPEYGKYAGMSYLEMAQEKIKQYQ